MTVSLDILIELIKVISSVAIFFVWVVMFLSSQNPRKSKNVILPKNKQTGLDPEDQRS